MKETVKQLRELKASFVLLFAILCVFVVIVGNVIILISINFWISVFPSEELLHNSSQIAIQVVAMIFIVTLFSIVMVAFTIAYGTAPLWHILVDRNRRCGPLMRFFLLFASGATNGISSVLGVYGMTYTPEFLQAVLMCSIPFCAQAWTVVFIKEERKRNYLSLFFVASFLFFVAGVLLSSISSFLNTGENTVKVEWSWTLIYLLSCIIFGLWCVVQRLYLDGVVIVAEPRLRQAEREEAFIEGELPARLASHEREPIEVDDGVASASREGAAQQRQSTEGSTGCPPKKAPAARYVAGHIASDDDDEHAADEELMEMLLEKEKRHFADTSVDANAAKVVLLVVGILFQLLISFIVFPADAIPWFGTSSSAVDAWHGFRNAVDFIFASWENVRYGLLYSLGYAMSFFGCTYLNEHSPTLASVVLQLAGPITSIIILIVPKWNVYQDFGFIGHKIGGVILLLVAAVAYHFWEQQSMRELMAAAEVKRQLSEMNSLAPREQEGEEAPEAQQKNVQIAMGEQK
ncbi:hypothetical protein STCU_06187 [Strigomonas culicis]|uniref:Uncharacterized protein n=1 Tax=Strigomonas culicis TaxID=28005 RepID=S9UCD0_9TRYP|nr:hypothetical protein STCU_06187 [Strigomonas culicis]|eukprot:EPY26573.1 hypothetical protein STCU_06187 [Strigomonas culicis]